MPPINFPLTPLSATLHTQKPLLSSSSMQSEQYNEHYARYSTLRSQIDRLYEMHSLVGAEQKALHSKILASKEWLVKQPQMQDFVEKLQQYLQQKNVVAFNEMLSGFVADVLQKDKQIELELYTSHSLPALRIHALNQGSPESIMDGSGGSLANIVSTGLRIIAAARSPNRKFLVLDEADCWIKPERIELFAKVIGEISTKLGMQIVMISHHSAKFFESYGRVVEIKKIGGKIEALIVSDIGVSPEQQSSNYIESIRLQDFMSHEDTHIEFHPNITCIIGENDIGKSAVGACIRALARNSSEDAFVKTPRDYARATLSFDHGYQVLWQRNKKLTQDNKHKVYYELSFKGDILAQEYNSYECPNFVSDKLNIREIDNIDVHLAHQKEPTFLIDSKTKPQDKAKILSLGKESAIVQKMMEKIKEKGKTLRGELKKEESDYHKNSRVLLELELLPEMTQRLETIEASLSHYKSLQHELSVLGECVSKISIAQNIVDVGAAQQFDAQNLTIFETATLEALVARLEKSTRVSNLGKTELFTENLTLQPTDRLGELINALTLNQAKSEVGVAAEFTTEIALLPTQRLSQTIELIELNARLHSVGTMDDSASALVQSISKISDAERISKLSGLISRIEAQQKIAHIEPITGIDIHANLAQLKTPQSLSELIESLMVAQEKMSQLKVKEKNAAQWLDALERDKVELYQSLGGVCPCCGNKIKSDAFFVLHGSGA